MQGQSKSASGPRVPPARSTRGQLADEDCCLQLNADALHDLFGPVNRVRSMAELILKRYRGTLDNEAEALFGFMRDSSDQLQNLLSGLRAYMDIVGQRRPFRVFDANAVLAGALAMVQQTIDRNDAIVTHDPLPELYGDPSQISYIFASLIENSIKFRSECRPEIHVTAIRDQNEWLFSVCDNGIGIDPRFSDRIFGVFKRIHNEAYPGAGMGLAIADRIMERHGGRIWVESHVGQGSKFFLVLPVTAELACRVASGESLK